MASAVPGACELYRRPPAYAREKARCTPTGTLLGSSLSSCQPLFWQPRLLPGPLPRPASASRAFRAHRGLRISRTWPRVAIRRNWQRSQISSSNSLPTASPRPNAPMYTWATTGLTYTRSGSAEVPVRIELHVVARGDVFYASDESFLVKTPRNAAGNPWPIVVLIIVRDVAHQRHAPELLICRVKTNAADRNRHPDHISLGGQLAAGVPHRIVGIVGAAVL